MSKRIALVAVLAGLVAACQPQQPDVAMQPAPVSVEPVYQGKF